MSGKRYIVGWDSRQSSCLPECLDELIEQENPIRFIEVYVDSLDIKALGFTRAKPSSKGRPSYHPGDLLKLYIYGYLNRIRSSRRLELECGRNIELWWLLNRLQPDHNTISDFRMENRRALKKVFQSFVKDCIELELVGGETVCIDGTKVRAVNSKKRSTNRELAEKKLEYARAQLAMVDQYLSDLDEADIDQGAKAKPFALDISPEELPSKEELKRRIAMHEEHLRIMAETGETQLLFTDTEARNMYTKDGSHPCYNIQTATDVKKHLIVAFEVSSNSSDHGQLHTTAEAAKAALDQPVITVIADKGYEGIPDMERCILNGVIPEVAYKYDRVERVFNLEYSGATIDEATRLSREPEDIRACLHAGVLPACYEGSGLRVEVHRESVTSCFIRHEDGRVTCPTGRVLTLLSERGPGKNYRSFEACRTCPTRCTDAHKPKVVYFGPDTAYVPVKMYGNPTCPLQEIPKIKHHNKNHIFGHRGRKEARVMLYLRRDRTKYKLRMQVAEHPFGTIKWYDGAHYVLCKGKEKVAAEIALSYLSYNIRRAIQIYGVQGLVSHFCRKRCV